jgi:acyl carrier protein
MLQLTPSSEFAKDLGLDSLDTVEVVMAIEEVLCSLSPTSLTSLGIWH